MEGMKKVGFNSPSSSLSSLSSDIFGPKQTHLSPSSSPDNTFDFIFSRPSKAAGGQFITSELNEKRKDFTVQDLNMNSGASGDNMVSTKGNGRYTGKDVTSVYSEQSLQPFHLSSSIYYGGQEIYGDPRNRQEAAERLVKDGEEDDPGSASRGNWWQGSLYY